MRITNNVKTAQVFAVFLIYFLRFGNGFWKSGSSREERENRIDEFSQEKAQIQVKTQHIKILKVSVMVI